MPVRFRCLKCNQMLSVSRRKQGTDVSCPACGEHVRVPAIAGAATGAADATRSARPEVAVASSSPEARTEPLATETAPGGKPAAARSAWDGEMSDWEDHPAFTVRKSGTLHDVLDMTSLVDVVFLLLVFFMITASFSVQKVLQTEAPEPDDGAVTASAAMTMDDLMADSVLVEISADNTIQVDDAPVAGLSELAEVLTAKMTNEGKTEMLIQAEYQATHGTVVGVTDTGIEVGMQRVRRVSRKADD